MRSPQLGDLTQAWATDPSGQDRPDWTHIRGFLDYLTLNPDAVAPSTAQMPEPSGSDFMDNLMAGIAEKACDDAGIARPSWTRHVPPLTHRWASPGTPRMRQRAMELTPPQLASRGINMTADSLWRNPLRMVANTDSHLVGSSPPRAPSLRTLSRSLVVSPSKATHVDSPSVAQSTKYLS